MTIYFLPLFGLYFVLLLALRVGWSSSVVKREKRLVHEHYFISIVIPVRNEENNIGTLMNGLINQNYSALDFEVIIVDDHSTDGTFRRMNECKGVLQNLSIITLPEKENGKKAGLSCGINHSKGNIIATTDADCLVPPDWLTIINSAFQNPKINLAAGMVAIADEREFFSRWQAMEFASVMGTSAGMFGLNNPIMCNGANLSFRKEVFKKVSGYEGNEHIASGDDEFLLRKISNQFPGSVQILNSIVITQPQNSLKEFFQQRIRWASKWKENPSIGAKLGAVFILCIQVSWIVLFLRISIDSYKVSLVIIALKIIGDLFFLLPLFRFLKIKFRLIPFLGLQFLYPFYVIFIGLLSPWIGFRWKARKIL